MPESHSVSDTHTKSNSHETSFLSFSPQFFPRVYGMSTR